MGFIIRDGKLSFSEFCSNFHDVVATPNVRTVLDGFLLGFLPLIVRSTHQNNNESLLKECQENHIYFKSPKLLVVVNKKRENIFGKKCQPLLMVIGFMG